MKNGRGGAGLVREERLQIMLSPEELKAVDNFRFESCRRRNKLAFVGLCRGLRGRRMI